MVIVECVAFSIRQICYLIMAVIYCNLVIHNLFAVRTGFEPVKLSHDLRLGNHSSLFLRHIPPPDYIIFLYSLNAFLNKISFFLASIS